MLSSSFVEYKAAIGILETTSKHVKLVTETIKKVILPKLKHHYKLLDVGAGAGNIAKNFLDEFEVVCAVEVNPELKSLYNATKIKLYSGDFMNMKLDDQFDLVICSHVMYHLDTNEMSLFINKLLSLVRPGGYCFMAMMAPRGQNHKFHRAFNPDYINSKQIITLLEEQQIAYDIIQVQNSFTTNNFSNMRNLLRFFAIEDCQRKQTKDLDNEEIKFIEIKTEQQAAECKKEGGYELEQQEDYFIVQQR